MPSAIGVSLPGTFGPVEFRTLDIRNVGQPVSASVLPVVEHLWVDGHQLHQPRQHTCNFMDGQQQPVNLYVDGITDQYSVAGIANGTSIGGTNTPGTWQRFRWMSSNSSYTIQNGTKPTGAQNQLSIRPY